MSFSSISIQIIRDGKKKRSCFFLAVAIRCCLPGASQVSLVGWQPWEQWQLLFKYCFLRHGPCARPGSWAREVGSWHKLLLSILLSHDYKSSDELAVSGQEERLAAATKGELPLSRKEKREANRMTIKKRVRGEKVPAVACERVAPSLKSAATSRQTGTGLAGGEGSKKACGAAARSSQHKPSFAGLLPFPYGH